MGRIITFTTDFGQGPYVAEMKGVALGICPDAVLVDVTHAVPPQDVRYAAFVLRRVVPCFPEGTIHVAVVDPGVGTERRILCFSVAGRVLIGPDNGVLAWAVDVLDGGNVECRVVENHRLWRPVVSRTFHGRDIMTPVAAHLAAGAPLEEVGAPTYEWVRLPWPVPEVSGEAVRGEIIFVDPFGNLITNIPGSVIEELGKRGAVACAAGEWDRIKVVETYGQAQPGEIVCLVGSTDLVEIAVVNGSASERLQLGPGAPVVVRLERPERKS